MSDSVGFVVLNYKNHDESVRCVESILALPEACPIVVVDNLSPNDSFEVLQRRFADEPRVTVVQSGRNGGYSSGNNVGIRLLRSQGVHNVVIATSDTRVESSNLVARCLAARDAGVAVLGPYVRGDEPGSANPMLPRLTWRYIAAIHMATAWNLLKKLRSALVFGGQATATATPTGTAAPAEDATAATGPASQASEALQDVYMVHGCFLFLSQHYLRDFPELDEDLFMYGEEDLIAFNCARRRLRVVYDPGVKIYHGDAKSTSPGEFRQRTVAKSMVTLRRKMRLGQLLHVYLHGH